MSLTVDEQARAIAKLNEIQVQVDVLKTRLAEQNPAPQPLYRQARDLVNLSRRLRDILVAAVV